MFIKKIVLLILCFLSFSCVAAEWRFIEENESRVRYYIDDSTIKPEKSMRRVWMLLDRKTPDKFGDLSTRIFTEFDCEQKKHRLLQVEGFKKNMATGAMSSSDAGVVEWRYISPATVINEVLEAVCKPLQAKVKSNKKPLNDCNEEVAFIKFVMKLRQQGMPIQDAFGAAEYAERNAARPDDLDERLRRRKMIVQYAYVGNPTGSEESARVWFDACFKENQRLQ